VKHWSVQRLLGAILLGLGVWAALAALCLAVGSTGQFGWPDSDAILNYRWQMVLLASLVGAALASAGVVYQALLRNPLADPYLLGVSSGAVLASYLWHLPLATTALSAVSALGFAAGEQACAFTGALLSVAVVFLLASRRGRIEPVTLLLVGVIVNAINGSVFLLINAVVKDQATPGGPLAFLVGGLQTSITAQQWWTAVGIVGAGWVVLLYISGQLNVARLSDAEATSLGVRIHRLRWVALIVASLVTASAVAISGPIGFVGLVCPHLGRLIVGNDQRKLLPLATGLGAGLLAVADAASRTLGRVESLGTVLPVGVLTGLLGGPFFLLLLYQTRRQVQMAEGLR
jgi:iron complex transport system permease protein